jgi:xylan 1,4-beta-xylosidase
VPFLPPPRGVVATGGVGQVTITWEAVDGAIGYQIYRSDSVRGPFEPVDHGGGDVLAVPHSPYVDTTGTGLMPFWYAVASVAEVSVTARPGAGVSASMQPRGSEPPVVDVRIDARQSGRPLSRPWRPMIGSERLSQLLCTDTSGGRVIGTELEAALRRMHDEIGVQSVRAHAIFHDDVGVYREVDGVVVHDFSVVDRIYDRVIRLGLRPVVELGFMPRDLASDPARRVFAYDAIISPPSDYDRWGELVAGFVRHLIDRYGLDEVLGWEFEVWNEANLEVFWSGTKEEWLRLYDVTAMAVKGVDQRLSVGGPSSAAAGWVDELLAHCRVSGAAVDFVSTHTYGSPPLDLRATLERHGFGQARVLWTEWGVTPRHFNPINDSVFAGVFLLKGMRSAAGRIDALSYWVASDHFEELGRPPRLLHGGFGLLTVGNVPKPRFLALRMLAALGERELPVRLEGDGAGSLVEVWATRHVDDRLSILIWNLTLDQHKGEDEPALTRRVNLSLPELVGSWTLRTSRLGAGSGDIVAAAAALEIGEWPLDGQWEELARAVEPELTVSQTSWPDAGSIELTVNMPSAVLLQLTPVGCDPVPT